MESEHTFPTERLWTPWRMRYINGDGGEEGCIFCSRLAADNDVQSLILHRSQHSFIIMNLYPYNTGHIMLVPNAHAADPSKLSRETLHEMSDMLPVVTTSLRRVFSCAGFNIGLNIGAVAGAGVTAHLHQHIVPRWQGDANFMPILASTMVIPETIPVTYAKIRAEIEREIAGTSKASFVLFDQSGAQVLLRDGHVPDIDLESDRPVWKSVIGAVPQGVESFEVTGWAGMNAADALGASPIVLTLRGTISAELPGGWASYPVDSPHVSPEVRSLLRRAQAQLAPTP